MSNPRLLSLVASSLVIFGGAADAIDIVKNNNTVTAANTAQLGYHHVQF